MLIYILIMIGISIIVRVYQLYKQAEIAKITYPSELSYLSLIKDMALLKTTPSAQEQLQTRFMTFIADLGTRSLEGGSGVGYFKVPNLSPVFVLSNKALIQQLYAKKNERKFGQRQFFHRLEVILGSENLMSSILGSEAHSKVRNAILLRNEANRPHVADMVADFFKEYEFEQGEHGWPLSEVMDKLSRRVLLITYFGKSVVKPFESFYQANLTKELMSCLFSLEPIGKEEEKSLLFLRSRVFNLGWQIIFSSEEITKQLTEEQSWLNYLLVVRVLNNTSVKSQLDELGINATTQLTAAQCRLLIDYSVEHSDTTPLSALVRDVVNESLFIPLLGFDATATVLITALRIALQDKRIYSMMKQEIQQKISANEHFELHSPWDSRVAKGDLSYAEAVLLEALRLSPPAPIVPEIIHETINLELEGTTLTLPAGSLIFIPLQGMHTHIKHVPDIDLSTEGQEIFGKKTITANEIFPERWGPKNHQNEFYNTHFFAASPVFNSPGTMEKEGGLLTFKTGARRCPGLRIAMTEIMALFRMLVTYKFELTAEEHLELHFNYEKPLQRNGGLGFLKIRPRKPSITLDTDLVAPSHQSGLNFFPELQVAEKVHEVQLSVRNNSV